MEISTKKLNKPWQSIYFKLPKKYCLKGAWPNTMLNCVSYTGLRFIPRRKACLSAKSFLAKTFSFNISLSLHQEWFMWTYLRIVQAIGRWIWRGVYVSSDQSRDQTDRRGWRLLLGASRLGRESTSTTLQTICSHYFLHHAHCQTFLESAKLAPIPSSLVHRAVLVGQAHIFGILLDGALKKTFTTFTSPHPIVLASRIITTNSTQ